MLNSSGQMTQQEFGDLVGISQQMVSDLVSRSILKAGQPAAVWLHAYCSHLREVAAGRIGQGGGDLVAERARLAAEQADKIAMQNAVTRRELAPTYLLEEILAGAGARAAQILDAIPAAIRRRNQNLTAADIESISVEVAKARNLVADITLEDVTRDEAADDPEGVAAE